MPDGASILLRVIAAIFDGGRREAWLFTALAVLLVLVRSAVFIVQGYVDFDSDQAIVGLMAKHLSEFRTFPLFFYGQNYMLGVQSWIIAPFFWVARPSIAVMKTPLVLLNILAAVLLMRGISRQLGSAAGHRICCGAPVHRADAGRRRELPADAWHAAGSSRCCTYLSSGCCAAAPFAFGALLAFGFLHREFTMYALPALALVELADRSSWTANTLKRVALGAGGFALVWLILDDAKMHLNGNSLLLQAQQLGKFTCFGGLTFFDRVALRVHGHLAGADRWHRDAARPLRDAQFSGRRFRHRRMDDGRCHAPHAGQARLAGMGVETGPNESSIAFAVYLALVGCCALAAYSMTCSYAYPVVRYFNLALLLPIGCFAAFMAREPSARLRQARHRGLRAVGNREPRRQRAGDPRSVCQSARQPAWRADRVPPRSPDPICSRRLLGRVRRRLSVEGAHHRQLVRVPRIPEYQQRVDEHSDAAVQIERMPCEGQMHVAVWCIQLPANRPGEGAR